MTNLTKIIEEAFEAGWDANNISSKDKAFQHKFEVYFGRSYQHYLDEFIKTVDEKLNPGCEDEDIREIIDEAFERRWKAYETSQNSQLDYESSPPILTKEIFIEIYKAGNESQGHSIFEFIDRANEMTTEYLCEHLQYETDLLKKYNLGE